MIDDPLLRWALTALFVLSALECVLAVGTARGRPVPTVGHLLHLVMAVAMGVMVWPRGADLPATAPTVFFGLAAVWFLGAAAIAAHTPGGRVANGYHAVMMLAMAWMYVVHDGDIGGGSVEHGAHHGAHHHDHHHHHTVAETAPGWVSVVNGVLVAGFALAAVFWVYRYFSARRGTAEALTREHFGVLCQALMAAGMAIMFGTLR